MKKGIRHKKGLAYFLRFFLLSLLAALIGVNVYTMNAAALVGDALPMPFGVGASVVLSGSMEPKLSVGDLIIVAKRDSYQEGDVVVYQDGKIAVAHRILSITGEEVVTKGDANNTEDDVITLQQIKGKVVCSIPFVGYLVSVVKHPIGSLTIIVLAIFLWQRSFRADKVSAEKEIEKIKEEIERLKEEHSER